MKTVNTILLGTLIALTLACGYSKKNSSSGGAGSMPAISQLNPSSTTAGDPGFTLVVAGSNFATNAVVNWNGTAQTTAFGSGQVSIAVPATAVATAGTVQITVTNPATGGVYGTPAQTSPAMAFKIN